MIKTNSLFKALALAIAGLLNVLNPAAAEQPPQYKLLSISPLKWGGFAAWSHSGNNLIAYSVKDEQGVYQVHTMKPDGAEDTCLTCTWTPGAPGVRVHKGFAYWHPSGEWLVVQVEMEMHAEPQFVSEPGRGQYNNLWLMSLDGRRWVKLTDYPHSGPSGVLNPRFSHNGRKLFWAEEIGKVSLPDAPFGRWQLVIADLVVDSSGPHLENIRRSRPGLRNFYETQGFSANDDQVIFTADANRNNPSAPDIFTMDVDPISNEVSNLSNLTDTQNIWDEHASFSPDGSKISYMSAQPFPGELKTELFLMDANGSNKTQVTHFNTPDFLESSSETAVAADNTWSADGTQLVVEEILAGPSYGGLHDRRMWLVTFQGSRGRIVSGLTLVKSPGGRMDWSRSGNDLIAFDQQGLDGYYDIYTMRPDGSGQTCITCDKPWLVPQRNNGNPAWHPSGQYIVFQAEKRVHPGPSAASTPGFGAFSDLWVATADGRSFTQLTHTANTLNTGVLHPHFSADGTQLSWSEMFDGASSLVKGKEAGYWKLKVADFSIGPNGPRISNIREFEPIGTGFYENHGYSPDGSRLLFCAHAGSDSVFESLDIYSMDLATHSLLRLTDHSYNEHAHYSPDGRKIAWMTRLGNTNSGSDLWWMNADGTGKERLTCFNDPECAEHTTGNWAVVADSSWSPDGTSILVFVFDDLLHQKGEIFRVDLAP